MRFNVGQKIDHYEVVEQMGEGAYGETYKVRDLNTGATALLKHPNPQLFADPAIFQRYQREAEIARRLDHPGVQRSLDDGATRSEPYMVMEFVEGENLRHRLRRMDGRVPVEQAIEWGRQLASAIAYLHSRGIVHRDLKPENVLVTGDDSLKIVDFGSALLAGARRLTWRHLSQTVGTPDYMSPEQIQGERGDPRSDIYAWGVMMYEFLSGRVPFGGDNYLASMAGHMQRTPEPIRRRRPAVPKTLEVVVLKAMRRYPENRYQSAVDLIADLHRLEELDPSRYDLSPEPPMGGMAAAGSAKRLWMYVGVVAAVFTAVVALVIGLTVWLR